MQTGVSYEDVSIRPDWRQLLIDELLSILAAVVLLIVGGLDGVPYHSVFFCVALALGFKVYYRIVYLRTMLYTITGEQLVYEHGVFSRSRDYIELYRIVDYQESRTLMQRLLGVKTVTVYSTDKSDAVSDILGVPAGMDLVGMLREKVEECKRERNIYEIANR